MVATAPNHQRLFLPVLILLIALAWGALLVWSVFPGGPPMDHTAAGLPDNAPGEVRVAIALLFIAGWTVMTIAMMLPTSLPLVVLFRRVVDHRRDAALLLLVLLVGYLLVWVGFGVLAYLADMGLHELVEHRGWLRGSTWVLGVAPLLLAGVYQFTPLKTICLKKCRSPLGFVTSHWHGQRPAVEALRLGLDHGLFCVGCCWSLMLVLFAVGMGQLAWMLVLAAIMAVEKNAPWGRRLTAPLGFTLIGTALALGLSQSVRA
jgi:predicted metal-binding membrane protein